MSHDPLPCILISRLICRSDFITPLKSWGHLCQQGKTRLFWKVTFCPLASSGYLLSQSPNLSFSILCLCQLAFWELLVYSPMGRDRKTVSGLPLLSRSPSSWGQAQLQPYLGFFSAATPAFRSSCCLCPFTSGPVSCGSSCSFKTLPFPGWSFAYLNSPFALCKLGLSL